MVAMSWKLRQSEFLVLSSVTEENESVFLKLSVKSCTGKGSCVHLMTQRRSRGQSFRPVSTSATWARAASTSFWLYLEAGLHGGRGSFLHAFPTGVEICFFENNY